MSKDDFTKSMWFLFITCLVLVLGLLGIYWASVQGIEAQEQVGADADGGRVATIADMAWWSSVTFWVVVICVAGVVVSAVVLFIRIGFWDFDLEPIPAIAGWVERVGATFVVTSDDGEVWVFGPDKVLNTSVIVDPSIQTGYLRNDSPYHRSLVLPPRVWKAYRRALRWGR